MDGDRQKPGGCVSIPEETGWRIAQDRGEVRWAVRLARLPLGESALLTLLHLRQWWGVVTNVAYFVRRYGRQSSAIAAGKPLPRSPWRIMDWKRDWLSPNRGLVLAGVLQTCSCGGWNGMSYGSAMTR